MNRKSGWVERKNSFFDDNSWLKGGIRTTVQQKKWGEGFVSNINAFPVKIYLWKGWKMELQGKRMTETTRCTNNVWLKRLRCWVMYDTYWAFHGVVRMVRWSKRTLGWQTSRIASDIVFAWVFGMSRPIDIMWDRCRAGNKAYVILQLWET